MVLTREEKAVERITWKLPDDAKGAQIDVVTRILALQERTILRPSWNNCEIRVLLQGAGDCVAKANDVENAQKLLERAEGLFLQSMRTVNRNWYVAAMLAGIALVAALGWVVWTLAGHKDATPLAGQNTIVALFAFAAMGSMTSVLMRLTDLDLRFEVSRKFIIYLAIAKPFVAISFASVVYVILANGLVSFGKWDPVQQEAVRWVAAFLCGFSERFASDVLERVGLVSAKPTKPTKP